MPLTFLYKKYSVQQQSVRLFFLKTFEIYMELHCEFESLSLAEFTSSFIIIVIVTVPE